MPEFASPLVVAVGKVLVFPSGLMSDPVVVSAQRCEIVDAGGSAIDPSGSMVEVAVRGGHATPRKDTSLIAGFDGAALVGGGATPGGPVVQGPAGGGVRDRVAPFGVLLFCGDLSGDVGNDGPVAGELARVLRQAGEGVEIHVEVDHATVTGFGAVGLSHEQV